MFVETVFLDGKWVNRYSDLSYTLSSHDRNEDAVREGKSYAMAKRLEHVIRDEEGNEISRWNLRNR